MRMLIGGKLYQSGKVSMLETGLKGQAYRNTFDALSHGATKGFKRNRNSHYEIIKKIVPLKVQAHPLMNL